MTDTFADTADKLVTASHWCVYIILSSDNRLYTGITTNMVKRWHAHANTASGAKFFRGRSPQQLLLLETGFDRSTASQREAAIKKLNRRQKLALIARQSHLDWHAQLQLPSHQLPAPSHPECGNGIPDGTTPPPPTPPPPRTPPGE